MLYQSLGHRHVIAFQKGIWTQKANHCHSVLWNIKANEVITHVSQICICLHFIYIFCTPVYSIWLSYLFNFEQISGVRTGQGEQLSIKLGPRKQLPSLLPDSKDQHGSSGRNQSENALGLSWTIVLPGISFCIAFCSTVFVKGRLMPP